MGPFKTVIAKRSLHYSSERLTLDLFIRHHPCHNMVAMVTNNPQPHQGHQAKSQNPFSASLCYYIRTKIHGFFFIQLQITAIPWAGIRPFTFSSTQYLINISLEQVCCSILKPYLLYIPYLFHLAQNFLRISCFLGFAIIFRLVGSQKLWEGKEFPRQFLKNLTAVLPGNLRCDTMAALSHIAIRRGLLFFKQVVLSMTGQLCTLKINRGRNTDNDSTCSTMHSIDRMRWFYFIANTCTHFNKSFYLLFKIQTKLKTNLHQTVTTYGRNLYLTSCW